MTGPAGASAANVASAIETVVDGSGEGSMDGAAPRAGVSGNTTPGDNAPAERAPGSGVIMCPNCGAAIVDGENFCEACGTQLVAHIATDPPPLSPTMPTMATATTGAAEMASPDAVGPCPGCGSTASTDGWCDVCGTRVPTWRDHYTEQPADWVGGVCDRGIRHHRNEDAMALVADKPGGSYAALIVCDGVSSTPDSDVAAFDAVRAAGEVVVALGAELRTALPSSPAFVVQTLCQALIDAGGAAHSAATAAAKRVGVPGNPPSCTFAAAIVTGEVVAAGWAGDSRVYWLPDGGAGQQLSVDDSWATQQILSGVPRSVAEADPQAHAITRWLGADSTDPTISCASVSTHGHAGWVLVCSDGLWNYVSAAEALSEMVAEISQGDRRDQPASIAQALVDYANGQGGHDNITVALARLDGVTANTPPTTNSASSAATPVTSAPTNASPVTATPVTAAPVLGMPDSRTTDRTTDPND